MAHAEAHRQEATTSAASARDTTMTTLRIMAHSPSLDRGPKRTAEAQG
jgi:hypothetical protein